MGGANFFLDLSLNEVTSFGDRRKTIINHILTIAVLLITQGKGYSFELNVEIFGTGDLQALHCQRPKTFYIPWHREGIP